MAEFAVTILRTDGITQEVMVRVLDHQDRRPMVQMINVAKQVSLETLSEDFKIMKIQRVV